MLQNFTQIRSLGEGSFGSVYLVKRHSDDQLYALKKVKMLSLSEKDKQNALNEIRLLASVNHPNIIQYKESFIDSSSQSLCLVMEYADGGDLNQKITEHVKAGTDFSPDEVLSTMSQAILGLKALHDSKICHRDLKCANIFLTKEGQVKLGDFNVSKVIQRGMLHTQTGTPYYASPEVWQDQPYDYKSDIWSLGCVLYEMVSKRPPFKSKNMKELYKKVITAKFPPLSSTTQQVPFEFNMLVRMILQPNPRLRPSCNTLLNQEIIQKCINRNGFVTSQCTFEDQLNYVHENPNKLDYLKQKKPQELLNTIKLTPKLSQLNHKLPKSNYETDSVKGSQEQQQQRQMHKRSQSTSRFHNISSQSQILQECKEVQSQQYDLQYAEMHLKQQKLQKQSKVVRNNIEECVRSLEKYTPSIQNIQQSIKTPRPHGLKQLELQQNKDKAIFYPSPVLASSSTKKNVQIKVHHDLSTNINKNNYSSEQHIVFRQNSHQRLGAGNVQQQVTKSRQQSQVFDNVNQKYREIMEQIIENENESGVNTRKINEISQNIHSSEMQIKPRYKSVVRNEIQSSLNPSPQISSSLQQQQSQDHRQLVRKRATNDLYSRIGEQITQTPRSQLDGMVKLPNMDQLRQGSQIQGSILEESLTQFEIDHQDQKWKRQTGEEKYKSNDPTSAASNNDYFYYDFITNSSIDNRVDTQPQEIIQSQIERQLNSEQKIFSNNYKSHLQLKPAKLDNNKENNASSSNLYYPTPPQQVGQMSNNKSRRNLVQRSNRLSLLV